MILFMSITAKATISLIALIITLIVFGKHLQKATLAIVVIATIIFSFAAHRLIGYMPPITEEIRLTALDEKRSEAKGVEVYLSGYTIDGEEFVSGESLQIEEGHWFWSGETYAWRPETDSRRPNGVTKTVILNIPVGWERILKFKGGVWRGKVEISYGDYTETVDTYTEDGAVKAVPIGKSNSFLLIMNQIKYIFVYVVILNAFLAILCIFLNMYIRHPNIFQKYLKQHGGGITYFGIAIFTFIFMIYYADKFPLWGDEMYNIGFSNGTLKEAVNYCLQMWEVSPPFPLIIQTIWYHITPYGLRWLMLISIAPSALSIFIIGKAGETVYGKYCGVLSSAFMAFSNTVWSNAAYEYRSYPFLLLFSTLTLYFYIRRNSEMGKIRNIVYYSISMTGMAMSHYFGMLSCVCFFLSDCYLLYRKRIPKRSIVSYLLPGSLSTTWLIMVFKTVIKIGGAKGAIGWQSIPQLSDIKNFLFFLSGRQNITYFFLVIGISISVICIFSLKSGSLDWKNFYIVFTGLTITISIALVFANGKMNITHTMWHPRYFLFLVPEICLLSSAIVGGIFFFTKTAKFRMRFSDGCLVLSISLLLFLNCYSSILSTPSSADQPWWSDAADWIYSQSNDIFNADTVIIVNHGAEAVADGWADYYVSQKGKRDTLNIKSISEIGDDISDYKTIYFVNGIDRSINKKVNERYELRTESKDSRVAVYVKK